MIEVRLTAFSFLGVFVAAHVVNVFLSWVIHYVQHQRVLGLDLYRIHFQGHHAVDRRLFEPRRRLLTGAISYALWAVLIFMFWVVYYFVFTEWVAFTFMAESVLLSVGIYYLHREYDDPDSWLGRFAWFRRARALHGIHHAHRGDFWRSVNYAIGGPLVGALPDRLFATLRDVRGVRRAASGNKPPALPAAVVPDFGPAPAAPLADGGENGSPGFGDRAGSVL